MDYTDAAIDYAEDALTHDFSDGHPPEGAETVCLETQYCIEDYLPNEILQLIFSYLTTVEISDSVLPVSRKWRTIGNHKTLWRVLNLNKYRDFKLTSYVEVVKKAGHLRVLECRQPSNGFLSRVVPKCTKLTTLIVPETVCVPSKTFAAIVRSCPDVTHLDISRSSQGYSTATALHCLTRWKGLKVLKLDSCNWINSKFIYMLANNCKALECVHLDCNLLPSHALCTLIDQLKLTLTELSLKCEQMTPELKFSLHGCSKLTELCVKVLIGPVILQRDDASEDSIAISRLSLYSCTERIDPHLKTIFGCTRFVHLTELFVYQASGDDRLAMDVGRNCPQLKLISLEMWSELSDVGVLSLLTTCKDVLGFSLTSCQQVVGLCFLLHFADCQPMEFISIDNCQRVPMSTVSDILHSGKVFSVNYV